MGKLDGAVKKSDELALWAAVVAGEWPRHAGQRLGIHPNRVVALCRKWTRKGVYEYGVSVDLGWPVPQPEGWIERASATDWSL